MTITCTAEEFLANELAISKMPCTAITLATWPELYRTVTADPPLARGDLIQPGTTTVITVSYRGESACWAYSVNHFPNQHVVDRHIEELTGEVLHKLHPTAKFKILCRRCRRKPYETDNAYFTYPPYERTQHDGLPVWFGSTTITEKP